MWDELSAAAMIDPSIITGQKELYVDIDVDHGPSYGETLFWDPGTELPPYERSQPFSSMSTRQNCTISTSS